MAAIFGFATCVTMLGPLLVDLSAELDVTLGQAGLLAAAMAVSWALAAPFAGLNSDPFGHRPVIVLALSGSVRSLSGREWHQTTVSCW